MTPKASKGQRAEEKVRVCLYEILGVSKGASEAEVKKAYRVRALQFHPDKNPSDDAKSHFQKLVTAYNILKIEESRKLYDETGYVEGDGFDKATEFFRTKFGRISEQDIVAFENAYKGSAAEVEDVKKFYEQNEGDISNLLEWIPLSDPSEVDRFVAIVDTLISEESVSPTPAYKKSVPKLRKNAAKMAREQAKFSKENGGEASSSLNDLVLAIKERQVKSEDFLDSLIDKYAVKKRKTRE